MYVEGTGRTPEEARENARYNAQMMRLQAGTLQFGLHIVWIMARGWVAFIWTLLLCTLRPVPGSILLAGIGIASLLRPLMTVLVSRQDHPHIHLLLDMTIVIGGLAVMAVIGRKSLNFLSNIEKIEARTLNKMLAERPLSGRIVHVLLYGYTILAAFTGAGALLWIVGQVVLPSTLWNTFTTDWRNAPLTLLMVMIILPVLTAVSAVLIRYHNHPFCRHLTVTGLHRSSPSQ